MKEFSQREHLLKEGERLGQDRRRSSGVPSAMELGGNLQPQTKLSEGLFDAWEVGKVVPSSQSPNCNGCI